ncbi:MAG: hypothetical protein HY896_02840 [Deltaproteobacteria bacterium]|nr:hypothetical protein [Deltaproteobacteria bacterium]
MGRRTVQAVLAVHWLLGVAGIAQAAHPVDVQLKGSTGAVITAGSNIPYSPKQTCGSCHTYEIDPTSVVKQQTAGGIAGAPYSVTVPSHGVSAGFHFQQGMNVAWGDTQRTYYGLPGFTSSPGMFGKY